MDNACIAIKFVPKIDLEQVRVIEDLFLFIYLRKDQITSFCPLFLIQNYLDYLIV
jgi:hypothetical protein